MLEAAIAVLTMIFSIIGYFLRQKDSQQGKLIDLLFKKHDEDAKSLQELRVQIASNHYERPELDKKFDKLESTFRDGFKDIGSKFDRLSDTLTEHMRSGAK